MKNGILNWLGKHDKIHYIFKCIRHINDLVFINQITYPDKLYPDESLYTLKMSSNGTKHKGKVLYKIRQCNYGFFSNFLYVLSSMWYADIMNMYPVVEWDEECIYYEKNGVNGIYNAWEYYFEQFEGLNLEDYNSAYRVTDIYKDVFKLHFSIENSLILTEECKAELGDIMKKYVCLKPQIEKYINQSMHKILDKKKTLGVQIRMGDALANCDAHPIIPTLDEYVEQIKKTYEKGYEQIFLATDDNRALKRLQKEFGDEIKFYSDITRVEGMYLPCCANTSEELHNYKCGLDVLRDMYTLAKCDGLVAGISNVNLVAQIAKISFAEIYDDLVIINKGINHNDRKIADYWKRGEQMFGY